MTQVNNIALLSRSVVTHQTTGQFVFCEGDELVFKCKTIEPPSNDNKKNKSSINIGDYWMEKYESPEFGWCFIVRDVEGRDYILFHWGNFVTDTKGCILVGAYFYDINIDGLKDIANSKATFKEMMGILPDRILLLIR